MLDVGRMEANISTSILYRLLGGRHEASESENRRDNIKVQPVRMDVPRRKFGHLDEEIKCERCRQKEGSRRARTRWEKPHAWSLAFRLLSET